MTDKVPALPSRDLLANQARWLASARSQLLRRASIAHRRSVLDLGSGPGLVTPELARRSNGMAYAFDSSVTALYEAPAALTTLRIAGRSSHLPFPDASLDLIFCQFVLLWVDELERTIDEIWRVLSPGGHFCAIEPDYPGIIEYPPAVAVRSVWLQALDRCGATSDIGRRLPGLLAHRGFKLQVRLLDQLLPPSPLRFTMMQDLPLEPAEQARVLAAQQMAQSLSGWQHVAHLPLFLINAGRPG